MKNFRIGTFLTLFLLFAQIALVMLIGMAVDPDWVRDMVMTYSQLFVDLQEILMPFRVTGTEGKFNAMIKVHGGGHHGQAGAIRHGIARAILQSDPEGARAPLRQAGLLSRDPRMKERKKYGLKRARKAPQFTKR